MMTPRAAHPEYKNNKNTLSFYLVNKKTKQQTLSLLMYEDQKAATTSEIFIFKLLLNTELHSSRQDIQQK